MRETHPELVFALWNRGPMAHHKSKPKGRQERLNVLARRDISFDPAEERYWLGAGSSESMISLTQPPACWPRSELPRQGASVSEEAHSEGPSPSTHGNRHVRGRVSYRNIPQCGATAGCVDLTDAVDIEVQSLHVPCSKESAASVPATAVGNRLSPDGATSNADRLLLPESILVPVSFRQTPETAV